MNGLVIHDKDMFTLKQGVIGFLNQEKRQYNDDEISSVRSRLSSRSKRSATSSCSSKTKLMGTVRNDCCSAS